MLSLLGTNSLSFIQCNWNLPSLWIALTHERSSREQTACMEQALFSVITGPWSWLRRGTSSFSAVNSPTWWFTSQLLVTHLTSWAHLVHVMRKERCSGQGCSSVPPWHFATMKLAMKAIGSWWHELSQLHTPKYTISFSGLRWTMCRALWCFSDEVWSFHNCLETPEFPSRLPWMVGLAKWSGVAGRQLPHDTGRS